MSNKNLPAFVRELFATDNVAEILKAKETNNPPREAFIDKEGFVKLTPEDAQKLCKKVNIAYHAGYESRVVQFTLTDPTVDRYGDVIDPKGVDFKRFMQNPVLLPFHNGSTYPIGTLLKVWYAKESNSVKGWVLFYDDEVDKTGTSDTIFRFVKNGALRAGSIGFMPKKFHSPDENEMKALGMPGWGYYFDEVELVEFSIVTVPANPGAMKNDKDGVSTTRALRMCARAFSPRELLGAAVKAMGWEEDSESLAYISIPIEEFEEDSIEEKDMDGVLQLSGTLNESKENAVQSYIFAKSGWDKDTASVWLMEKFLENITEDLEKGFVVQSFTFEKELFDKEAVKKWLNDNTFISDNIKSAGTVYIARQKDPATMQENTYKQVEITKGIVANLAKPAEKALAEALKRVTELLEEKAPTPVAEKSFPESELKNLQKDLNTLATKATLLSESIAKLFSGEEKSTQVPGSPSEEDSADPGEGEDPYEDLHKALSETVEDINEFFISKRSPKNG